MAEIKVKLTADTSELLKNADDARMHIEGQTAYIAVDADTAPFVDAVQQAVNQVQQLAPAIAVTSQPGPAGSPAQSMLGAMTQGASAAQAQGQVFGPMPAPANNNNNNTNSPMNALLKAIQSLQNSQQKTFQDLRDSIDGLKQSVSEAGKKGGPGQGQGQGNNNSNQNGAPWDWMLRFLGVSQKKDDQGNMQVDPMSAIKSGMSMLGAIPGLGQLASFLSLGGLTSLVKQQIARDGQLNRDARQKAADRMQDTYDVFGSVNGFDPNVMGEESYGQGTYLLGKNGMDYGYSFDEVLSASDALMSKAGFTDLTSFNRDITSVLDASRATGVDTNAMASLAGTATRIGLQENGDQGNILNTLGRYIEVSGMQGREDEMVDVMQKMLDELGSINANVAEQAVGDKLNLMSALTNNNPNLSGERAASAIDSIEDFTSSSDMSVMVAAGYGTQYTGKEGWLELRRMQAEDPTKFMETVITNLRGQGRSQDDILMWLDQKGIGNINTNEEVVNAIYNGDYRNVPDMNDTEANRTEGQAAQDRKNAAYQLTVAPYTQNYIREDIADINLGEKDWIPYKDKARELNSLDASGAMDSRWKQTRFGEGLYETANRDNSKLFTDREKGFREIDKARETGSFGEMESTSGDASTQSFTQMSQEQKSFLQWFDPNDDFGLQTASQTASYWDAIGDSSSNTAAPEQKTASDTYAGTEPIVSAVDAELTRTTVSRPRAMKRSPERRISTSMNDVQRQPVDELQGLNEIERAISSMDEASSKGMEERQALRRMQTDNPARFTEAIRANLRERGMPDDDTAVWGDQRNTGSTSLNRGVIDAVFTGSEQDTFSSEHIQLPRYTDYAAGLPAADGISGQRQNIPENVPSRRDEQMQYRSAAGQGMDLPGMSAAGFLGLPSALSGMNPDGIPQTQDVMASNRMQAGPWAGVASLIPSAFGAAGAVMGGLSDQWQDNVTDQTTDGVSDDFGAAIAKNTEELKKNTEALVSTIDADTYALGGPQMQSSFMNNGELDALSNSVSIQTGMTRQQTGGGLFSRIGSAVSGAVQGVGNFFSDMGQAIFGGGTAEMQTFSSTDGGTTTVTSPDGSQTVSGDIIPNAVGNDYVPYDGYAASLHKGEMVLPRTEADLFRQGRFDAPELLERSSPLSLDLSADNGVGTALAAPVPEASSTISFEGGAIDLNINISGQVQGLDSRTQQQIVQSVQAQIAGSGLREMISNGFTRRQNY